LVAASAESTKARLVWDFEPGTVTVAHTGVGADGAIQVLTRPSLLVCRLCHHGVMCGRFAVTTDPAALAEKIQAINEARSAESAAGPNYNVAPTTTITTVVRRHDEPDDEPSRRVRSMRWGLVPPWAKAGSDGAPESKGPQLINARAEKVTTSPAFRSSAKSKRCLVPMDGYYEWRANPAAESGKKARKTPFFLHRADGELLFMAGLWSVWKPAKDATPLLSCTIITTDAVGELAEIHDRMPLIVAERDWDRWLDPDATADLELLATPPDIRGIEMREISTLVNNVRNNGPELLEPAEPQPEQARLL
jgi:putative SOS response-associated peptidase YedK